MTKEVLLSLRGLQFDVPNVDGDKIETITVAEYYYRNGSHYVLYEEVAEGFGQSTKSVIKFKENCLELTKKGLVNVHMVFEKNRKNMANYSTPYGDILIGIDTKHILLLEDEDCIVVKVEYALEVNYEHFADCRIKIELRSKNGNGFTLK